MKLLNTTQCRSISGARAEHWTGFGLNDGIISSIYLQQGEYLSIKDGDLSYTLGYEGLITCSGCLGNITNSFWGTSFGLLGNFWFSANQAFSTVPYVSYSWS